MARAAITLGTRRSWNGGRREGNGPQPGKVLAAGLLLALVGGALVAPRHGGAVAGTPPDIVLVLTDDMRWDMIWAMPTVQSELIGHGVAFSNAYVVNSWCCPSRASILTGQYSHSTGVWKQRPPNGGFESFHDDSTAATWLDDGGYRTAFMGKYLNGYAPGSYIPPGWDRWVAFTTKQGQGNYFDYSLSMDGVEVSHGSEPADYSTDVLAGEAVSFIESTPVGQPLFLEWAPIAPHQPAVPAPRHARAFSDLSKWRPPNYNEDDVSDKPGYVRSVPRLSEVDQAAIDDLRVDMYRTLLAVDEAIGDILAALEDAGRLSNAMVIFASDNGYLWGEHRLDSKIVPYEESIRIPLVIRYDPLIVTPRSDARMVLNIDLAPTVAGAAGLPSPGVEGRSLLPLLSSSQGQWRGQFLVEHLKGTDRTPTFCAVRTKGYLYTQYATGDEELYDVKADPYEMVNRVTDPAMAGRLATMRSKLVRLCSPPPPGFVPGDTG